MSKVQHISEKLDPIVRIAEEACIKHTGKSSDLWMLQKHMAFVNDCKRGLTNSGTDYTFDGIETFSRRYGLLADDIIAVECPVEKADLTDREAKAHQAMVGQSVTVKDRFGGEQIMVKQKDLKTVIRFRIRREFAARAWANVKAYHAEDAK